MNLFFSFIFTSIIITGLHAQEYRGTELRPPDPKKGLLKVETYSFGNDPNDSTLTTTKYYNAKGYLIRETGYWTEFWEKKVTWENRYTYPAKNRRIETYTYDEDGTKITEKGEYFYNASGLIEKQIGEYEGNYHDTVYYLYNEKDQLIREKDCDEDGCVTDTIIYVNDKMSLVMRKDSTNEYFDSTVYVYNSKGHLLEWNSYRPDIGLYNTGKFVCNSLGKVFREEYILYRWVEKEYSKTDYGKSIILYQYYPKDQIKKEEEQSYEGEKLEWAIITEFDEMGNMIRITSYNENSEVIQVEKMIYYWR